MVDITTTGKNGVLNLGVQGENNARRVVFDTSNFSSSYGDGTAQVLYKPQGLNAYKVDITEDNGAAYWILKNTDTANDGYGELEFQWVNDKGALLAKPVRYRTFIKKSVEYDESGRPPEHYVSWIETLEKLAEKIEKGSAGGSGVSGGTIAATAEQKDNGALITITDANGTSTVFISNGADGAKGDPGAKGDKGDPGTDGVSPSAKVEQTEAGAVITVSDASGTTTAPITNGAKGDTGAKGDPGAKGDTGAKGDKGDPGTDGVSPSAKVEQTETGAVITIKDASGTTTATLTNGAKGETGAKGDPGAKGDTGAKGDKGDPGADGVSPSAKVEQTETGAVITVSDSSGTTTATITNGAKGETGAQGPQGIKGDPGAKGDTGAKGDKGDPGTSISITGTTESTDDGGNNTITFSDGTTLTIKNGKTGSAGTYTAGDGITISGGVISVSYGNAEEASV